MDLRSDKISNRLILFGLFLAFPYQIFLNGWRGIFVFSFHAILPVLLFYLLYRCKALGAGDIKLLSLISVFSAKDQFFRGITYIFAAGAMIGMCKLIRKRILLQRLKTLWNYAGQTILTGSLSVYDGKRGDGYWNNRIHFSIPILLGYIGSLSKWG